MGFKPEKGMSPLIAAVLLIAFTMSLAVLFGPWATQLVQDTQEGTSRQAADITRASSLGIEIRRLEFNRSSDNLEVVVQNKGDRIDDRTNISITVTGGSFANTREYEVALNPMQIKTLELGVDRTYPLERIRVDLTGYPISDESGIRCVPTEGLVGYWTLNDEQTLSGKTLDRSGYRNDGDILNGVSTDTGGKVGEAYRFDGNDDHVVIPDSDELDVDIATVLVWAKPSSEGGWKGIVGKTNLGSPPYSFRILQYSPNQAGYGVVNSAGDEVFTSGAGQIPLDKWSFLAVSFDGDQAVGYMNGKEVWSEQVSGELQSNGDIYVGADGGGGHNFNGKIDELKVYNRSLSRAEIQRIYSVRSKRWAVNACKMID